MFNDDLSLQHEDERQEEDACVHVVDEGQDPLVVVDHRQHLYRDVYVRRCVLEGERTVDDDDDDGTVMLLLL